MSGPFQDHSASTEEPSPPRAIDPSGTTVFLVLKDNGSMAAGVSTSGWAWKYPGRLGDSPVIGAGCYTDSRYGAAACTGMGEWALRACTSFSVVNALRLGLSVREACIRAAEDIQELHPPKIAALTIHAMAKNGEHHVLRLSSGSETHYFFWQSKMRKFSKRRASNIKIK